MIALAFLNAADWPTDKWRETSPEAQGLDSQALAAAIDQALRTHLGIHSLLVIRHGFVVLDTYFYPFGPGQLHDVASVTKSITSALVGIANDLGVLKTDQRILPLFREEQPANPDERKQQITIDDLLTNRPGLDCGFKPGEQELEQMRQSGNWVKTALDLPMRSQPGTEFGYCSPGFHLLSAAVTAATSETALEFGRKHLFAPLGIRGVVWPPDPQGRTHGWGDSHFYPRDLAKIGYLYLHGGQWEGKQIVSTEWVRRSITQHTQARAHSGYGYGWWLYNEQEAPRVRSQRTRRSAHQCLARSRHGHRDDGRRV